LYSPGDPREPSDFALVRYVEQQPVFNDLVSFEPLRSTFLFTPDPTGCPEGFVGIFSCEARLTNISDRALSDLVIEVIALTGGNLLHNADGGPGGVGAQLTVPRRMGSPMACSPQTNSSMCRSSSVSPRKSPSSWWWMS
jgi:hypothetical protein